MGIGATVEKRFELFRDIPGRHDTSPPSSLRREHESRGCYSMYLPLCELQEYRCFVKHRCQKNDIHQFIPWIHFYVRHVGTVPQKNTHNIIGT